MSHQRKNLFKSKLRKGDEVIVIAGSCKGKTGKISKLDLKNNRVFVGGVNLKKRHTKPTQENPDGGILEKPASLHISNVALCDPDTSKATRIGMKIEAEKKVRFAKKSGKTITK